MLRAGEERDTALRTRLEQDSCAQPCDPVPLSRTCCGVTFGNRCAVARRAVLSAQGVRSVQSTVLCQSVLCVFVRGALRFVTVRQKAHATQP